MSIPGSASPLLLASTAAAAAGYQVSRSLRFNSADSAYLSRTPAVAGNRRTWTWAGWVKRSGTSRDVLLAQWSGLGFAFEIDSSSRIDAYDYTSGYDWHLISTPVYRDPSAWYHIVFAYDTTQATASNRIKLYVNGTQVTTFSTETYPSPSYSGYVNTASAHEIGGAFGVYLDACLAEVFFIDGQALTPSSFTEVSATTGQLIPLAYSGSFGTNGFWLKFSDNSAATAATLGKDYSGNSNNWTPNNLSVTAGAGNDSLVDTPTSYGTDTGVGGEVRGNYATLNPLDKGSGVSLANGNLDATITTSDHMVRGTMAMPASGKWYFEFTPTVISGTRSPSVGIANSTLSPTESNGYRSASAWTVSCGSNGNKQHNSTETSYASAFAANDVGMCAVDLDNGKIWWGKNGTWFASGNPATGANAAFTDVSGTVFPAVFGPDGGVNCTCVFNFGQRAFAYPLSGFKALCDTNLGAPVVAKPNTVMDVKLYTGNGTGQAITGLAFSPDFIWTKSRSRVDSHGLHDIVRGRASNLYSDLTAAENTSSLSADLVSFDANGYTLGTVEQTAMNRSGETYVGWAWDAGTSTVSNTAGSITSQVRANVSAGFSVVTWTGTGSGSATIGHGLGVKPRFILVKKRNAAGPWYTQHGSLGAGQIAYLNSTDAFGATSGWNNTEPTSTVFSLGSAINDANTYVAYCFSPVVGYSSMGSYVGNGSADGPFVYTGFRPRWIMIKWTTATEWWWIFDTARDTYNASGLYLGANAPNAEQDLRGTYPIDILSNGFKIRNATFPNGSQTAIYAAFAESPFQYARAR